MKFYTQSKSVYIVKHVLVLMQIILVDYFETSIERNLDTTMRPDKGLM